MPITDEPEPDPGLAGIIARVDQLEAEVRTLRRRIVGVFWYGVIALAVAGSVIAQLWLLDGPDPRESE